jgi:hypothetical protein
MINQKEMRRKSKKESDSASGEREQKMDGEVEYDPGWSTTHLVLNTLFSAVFAGAVAVLVTAVIERWVRVCALSSPPLRLSGAFLSPSHITLLASPQGGTLGGILG